MMKFTLLTVAMAVVENGETVENGVEKGVENENQTDEGPLTVEDLEYAHLVTPYHVKDGVFQCLETVSLGPELTIDGVTICQSYHPGWGCSGEKPAADGTMHNWCWLVDAQTGNQTGDWAFCANTAAEAGCKAATTKEERFPLVGATAPIIGKKVPHLVKGETTEVKGETTEVKGETTEVKGETTEVKGETTEVKGETTEVKGETTKVSQESIKIDANESLSSDPNEDNAKDAPATDGASAMATVAASAIVLCMF